MADLQDIFNSGSLTELTLQTTDVRQGIQDLLVTTNDQQTVQDQLVSDLNVLTGRVNAIDIAILNLQVEQNEGIPEIIDTGVALGQTLSLAECQQYIPNPSVKRYTVLRGTGVNESFIVHWDGTDYSYERLTVAT